MVEIQFKIEGKYVDVIGIDRDAEIGQVTGPAIPEISTYKKIGYTKGNDFIEIIGKDYQTPSGKRYIIERKSGRVRITLESHLNL